MIITVYIYIIYIYVNLYNITKLKFYSKNYVYYTCNKI
jgi:hypothetical protein